MVLFVFLVGSWVGFKVFGLRVEHRRIEDSVGTLAGQALTQGSHGLIKGAIVKEMQSYDIILDPDDIKLEVSAAKDKVTLEFPYRRILDFIVVKRSYPFYVHVDKYPKTPAGALGEGVKKSIEKSLKSDSGRYSESFQNP